MKNFELNYKRLNKYFISALGSGLSLSLSISNCSSDKSSKNLNKNFNNNVNNHELINLLNPSRDTYKIKKNSNLILFFDCKTRNPRFVVEHLQSKDLINNKSPANKRPLFYIENIVDSDFMPNSEEYASSGFDRGHLAPAADFKQSQESFNATFSMANVSPQNPILNRGIWKDFESWARNLLQNFDDVIIITGPAFIPSKVTNDSSLRLIIETIGVTPHLIQVPTHFFKVIVTRKIINDNESEPYEIFNCAAFLVPNSDPLNYVQSIESLSPQSYLVKLSNLEAILGFKFFKNFIIPDFDQISDESIIEDKPYSLNSPPDKTKKEKFQRKYLSSRSFYLFHEAYPLSIGLSPSPSSSTSYNSNFKNQTNDLIRPDNLLQDIKILNQTQIIQPSNYPMKVYLSHLCSPNNLSSCSKPFRQKS